MDAISGPTVVLDVCSVWEPWVSSSGPQRLVFTAPLTSRAAPCQAMSLLVRHGKEFTPDRLTTGLPTWAGWGPPLSAYNEGRTMRLGASEFAYLHFHFESISTPNGLFEATQGNPLPLQMGGTCSSQPVSPVGLQKPALQTIWQLGGPISVYTWMFSLKGLLFLLQSNL